jgi:hypothetical protein
MPLDALKNFPRISLVGKSPVLIDVMGGPGHARQLGIKLSGYKKKPAFHQNRPCHVSNTALA